MIRHPTPLPTRLDLAHRTTAQEPEQAQIALADQIGLADRDSRRLPDRTGLSPMVVSPARRPCHEMIIMAHMATYRLPGKTAWPGEDALRYIECLKDVWLLPPGRRKRGCPVSFPDELVRRLILLYSCPGDVVLDPFAGVGTVGRVARQHDRGAWLIEREPSYWPLIEAVVGTGQAP